MEFLGCFFGSNIDGEKVRNQLYWIRQKFPDSVWLMPGRDLPGYCSAVERFCEEEDVPYETRPSSGFVSPTRKVGFEAMREITSEIDGVIFCYGHPVDIDDDMAEEIVEEAVSYAMNPANEVELFVVIA